MPGCARGCREICRARTESRLTAPRQHGEDQDAAFDDRLIVGRNVEDEQDIDHDHQDVGAEDRADRAAASAAKQGAADHDRREHLQEDRVADQGVARALLGGDEHARGAVAAAGDHKDHEAGQPTRTPWARAASMSPPTA